MFKHEVTEQTYPNLFKALQQVDLENGAINRLEPAREVYEVISPFTLKQVEKALGQLSPVLFETFCQGCEDETREIISACKEPELMAGLLAAEIVLNNHFEGL